MIMKGFENHKNLQTAEFKFKTLRIWKIFKAFCEDQQIQSSLTSLNIIEYFGHLKYFSW